MRSASIVWKLLMRSAANILYSLVIWLPLLLMLFSILILPFLLTFIQKFLQLCWIHFKWPFWFTWKCVWFLWGFVFDNSISNWIIFSLQLELYFIKATFFVQLLYKNCSNWRCTISIQKVFIFFQGFFK